MEKYIVIYKIFKDLQDKEHIYKKGDTYPREGYQPTQKRIKELASKNNKIGETLIKKIEEASVQDKVESDETKEGQKDDSNSNKEGKIEESNESNTINE